MIDWARIPGGPPAAFVRCTIMAKIATAARMVVEERGRSMMMMMMMMKEVLHEYLLRLNNYL